MRCALLLICCCLGFAASEGGVDMRWRICADETSQSSFRFPYDYTIPDQYHGLLMRPGRQVRVATVENGKPLSAEQIQQRLREAWSDPEQADILQLGGPLSELKGASADEPLLLAKQVSLGRLDSCEAIDYYAPKDDLARPFADPDNAPEDVKAFRLAGPKHCGRLLLWDGNYALLIATGAESDFDNQGIFDSFEIMTGRRDVQTWRATMSGKAMVLAPDGSLVKAKRSSSDEPVSWSNCWEVETAHYHVTCTVSPGTTLYYARLMEELYELYSSIYDPDNIPCFKMEVHIREDRDSFRSMASKMGFNIPDGWIGFFSPSNLCVYAYDRGQRSSHSTDNVLAHEASHQFLHVTCNGSGHVPTWINEGLAVYFESADFSSGRPKWEAPKQRLDRLKSLYRRGKKTLIPLEGYLAHHGPIEADQYAEVYAMTHFWVFGSKSGKKRFKEYWQALKEGEDGTAAFERIFLADMIKTHGSREKAFAAWEEALLRYVDKGYPGKK